MCDLSDLILKIVIFKFIIIEVADEIKKSLLQNFNLSKIACETVFLMVEIQSDEKYIDTFKGESKKNSIQMA